MTPKRLSRNGKRLNITTIWELLQSHRESSNVRQDGIWTARKWMFLKVLLLAIVSVFPTIKAQTTARRRPRIGGAIANVAFLLLLSSSAYGQVIQRSLPCQIPGNSSKITCSLSKATTSGSTIRAIEIDRSGAGTRSVAGLTLVATASGGGGTVSIFSGASNGTLTFTATLPSVYNGVLWVQEDTGGANLDSKVSASGAINQRPQPISAGKLTTTAASDYLIVGCDDNMGAGGLTAGSGYNPFQTSLTAPNSSAFVPGGFEDRLAGAAGSYAADGQLAFAQYQWTCLGVAFNGGSGPPPPPPPPSCAGTASMTVSGSTPPPLGITNNPVTLPGATVGTAYSVNLGTAAGVTGGVSPYSYSANTALPPGLIISSAGVISGIPTTAGTTTFTYTVTDSSGTSMVVTLQMVADESGPCSDDTIILTYPATIPRPCRKAK
jgi:hypothetical protein